MAEAPPSMRPGVRLGIDVGSVRVGVARSDPHGMLATPVSTLTPDAGVAQIVALVEHESAIEVIVGLPRHLSGAEGSAAASARAYAAELASGTGVPVRMVDERMSTVTAHRQMRGAGRPGRRQREVVDQVAAVVILQGALDAERSTGRPPGELINDQAAATKEDLG